MKHNKQLMILSIIPIVILLSSVSYAAQSELNNSPLTTIENDYNKGLISLDEKVLLEIKAIKDPKNLPDKYQTLASKAGAPVIRCATGIINEIKSQWDLLSLETQQTFKQAFFRPETEFTYISPSGFFKLHYDTATTDSVPSADNDSSGVPDFVEKCAAYCDTALNKHIELGYLLPPNDGGLGGDTLFDVYFEEFGAYGYAFPEGPGPEPWNDAYSYMVLNSDFLDAIFPPNNDPEGNQYGAAKVTCAHEFHHCCQNAYDYQEEFWFVEADAVYMEDIVFDQSDDNYNYVDNFLDEPERSLMENTNHAYGSFVWGEFLSQKFDTSLMVAVWEGARWMSESVFQSMGDSLFGRYGWTQDSALAEFITWNYCTATRDDGLHYEEGAQYPYVGVSWSYSSYPVTLRSSPTNPAGYGSCYLEFFPGTTFGKLHITFNGDDSRQWAAWVIKSTANNVHEFERMVLDTNSYYGTIDIPDFENYYRVALVGVNLSEYSNGAFYSYSADVIPPYSVSSSIMTMDSAVYSGGVRQFEYLVTNTSPLTDVFNITAWDDQGWIVPDTIDISLGPGEDSVVLIPVQPPQATPLGSISSLTFEVISVGDSMVTDTQLTTAKTVLQRGDLDFDGSVVVSDLSYLVDYLFNGGADPAPVIEAADFSCNTDVDVSDLSLLVTFLFQGGDPPVCNPY